MPAPKVTAERLIEALENAGYLPRSYSGRGDYGSRCVAVDSGPDSDDIDPFRLAVDLNEELEPDELASLRPSYDSMGRGKVVYFRSLKWPKGRKEE